MEKKDAVQLFENRKVRTVWDDQQEQWYFSVIDAVGILTDSPDPKRYWSVLKSRLKKEGCEPTTICSTLKLTAPDGKMRLTDVATQEQLFRLIQSIPSPKAEPFKQWMARVASERLDEMQDPEQTIDRAVKYLFLKFSPHILIFGILFVVLHYNKSIYCVDRPGQVNLRCRQ